jgi:hypothetical protein
MEIKYGEINKIMVSKPYHLSRILDGQVLMYKILSVSFKFQNRAQEWVDGDIHDGSMQHGETLEVGKHILSSPNLENVFSSKTS